MVYSKQSRTEHEAADISRGLCNLIGVGWSSNALQALILEIRVYVLIMCACLPAITKAIMGMAAAMRMHACRHFVYAA